MYDFHPDDAPHVRVQMLYSDEHGEDTVVDEFHKAVRLRVVEFTGRHSFRIKRFQPEPRIIRPDLWSTVSGKGLFDVDPKALFGDESKPPEHPMCKVSCAEMAREVAASAIARPYQRFHEMGAPDYAKAFMARPFLRPALDDVYKDVAEKIKVEIAETFCVPERYLNGIGSMGLLSGQRLGKTAQLRATENAMRVYRPLKVIPTFHPLHLRERHGLPEMSMKCTVAIVGAQYHRGAPDALRRLEERWKMIQSGRGLAPVKDKLELAREPDNAHDPNAIAFKYKGVMLGYVPRQDAKVVSKVIDAGVDVQARYNGGSTAILFWPASTKEGVEAAYRIAMSEGEGL